MNEITIDMSSPCPESPQKLLPRAKFIGADPSNNVCEIASAVIEMANESTAADSQDSQPEFSPFVGIPPDPICVDDVLEHLRKLESRAAVSAAIVDAHGITAPLRAKMVDWMIEVVCKAECNSQTLFLAVGVLDRFLEVQRQKYKSGDMHLMGVVAMLLASKFEDVAGLDVQFMFEQVVHKKVSVHDMVVFEAKMFEGVNYLVSSPTELEFLELYTSALLEQEALAQAQHVATLNLHSADLSVLKPSLRAAGSLLLVLNGGKAGKEAERVGRVSGYSGEEVRGAAERIAGHVKRFKELYPKLKNAETYC